jgi:hypothetical protein
MPGRVKTALHEARILVTAVGPFHRVAEGGEDTPRALGHTTRMVEAALAPSRSGWRATSTSS